VIARAPYIADAHVLRRAGVPTVVAAEAEVALAMAERLLDRLGATRDQLDRARDELRRELASDDEHEPEARAPTSPAPSRS
jgi:hypothetical protein